MKFMIERLGDISGKTFHGTLDDALQQLSKEYPKKKWEGEDEEEQTTPDPEDDRILIWEILDTNHSKVVWHFSGWHWNANEFGIPQGTLPGHPKDLYSMALEDY